jgi:hypothetical protein
MMSPMEWVEITGSFHVPSGDPADVRRSKIIISNNEGSQSKSRIFWMAQEKSDPK